VQIRKRELNEEMMVVLMSESPIHSGLILSLKNVHKSYGDIIAVNDLTLEINRGEIFGLLGPNGAGKSTCIGLAVGLLHSDKGEVNFNGAGSPTRPDVRTRIGVAPQALALYEDLTAEENLSFFGSLQDLRGSRLAERVNWALEFVGLQDRRRDRAKTYSGGMKRRLNLAVALLHDPELLLLDEPTVGVDPQSRNAIFDNILALKEKGRTIVYTTHYMEEVQKLCDRVGVIDHGKLLALDTVDGLIRSYGGKNVVVARGEKGEVRIETDNPVEELSRLHGEGALSEFRWERPDLETVFLNLTGRSLRDE
jgi:ABC-2 type transport system ATP-binding protein